MIVPIFKTHGSLGRSILTVENEDKISDSGPVSIVSIVKEYNLKNIMICDDTFLSFPSVYKYLNPITNVIFGINFYCCNDVNEKNSDSLRTESKISILMKNSNGYEDLLRIHNLVHTNDNYSYYKPRIDWKTITDLWTDNLVLLLPPYDNFIHNNLLKDCICVPKFGNIKPIMSFADMELPFDYLIKKAVKDYASNNSLELLEVHPVYYFNESDIKSYMVYRCIDERHSMSDPNLDFFTSVKFSFESYLKKINV